MKKKRHRKFHIGDTVWYWELEDGNYHIRSGIILDKPKKEWNDHCDLGDDCKVVPVYGVPFLQYSDCLFPTKEKCIAERCRLLQESIRDKEHAIWDHNLIIGTY